MRHFETINVNIPPAGLAKSGTQVKSNNLSFLWRPYSTIKFTHINLVTGQCFAMRKPFLRKKNKIKAIERGLSWSRSLAKPSGNRILFMFMTVGTRANEKYITSIWKKLKFIVSNFLRVLSSRNAKSETHSWNNCFEYNFPYLIRQKLTLINNKIMNNICGVSV